MAKKNKKTKGKHEEPELKKKGKGKKGKGFPEVAAPGPDEQAGPPASAGSGTGPVVVDDAADDVVLPEQGTDVPAGSTDGLSKKDRKRIEALELGVMHNLVSAEHLYRMRFLNTLQNGDRKLDDVKPKKAKALADAEVAFYRERGENMLAGRTRADAAERAKVKRQPDGTPKREPVAKVEKVNEPALDDELAAIKARVDARRQERYDALIAEGATEETARQMSRFQALRDEDPKGLTLGDVGHRIMTATAGKYTDAEAANELDMREPDEQTSDLGPLEDAVAAVEHEVNVVETETGREFVAGVSQELGQDILDPVDPNVDADGVRWSKHARPRPYIVGPDGKERMYSRVTGWIDVLDDKSALKDWDDRTLLIGASRASANLDPDTHKVEVVSFVNEVQHEYEHALKANDKALRKGKVSIREHADAQESIEKKYKADLRHLAAELRERGDAHVKAQKGTDLHQVFQDYDEANLKTPGDLTIDEWLNFWSGAEPIQDSDMVSNLERLSPADIADLRAYRAAMDEAGVEVIDCERRVVLDADGVTGTYDRRCLYRPRNGQRKVKVIGDVKTGRIDFSPGKFATQIKAYAEGEFYDPKAEDRTKREKLGVSQTVGLLIHSPAGQGTTTIYEVDLTTGKKGLALIRAVHDWRRETTEAKALRSKVESERWLFEVSNASTDTDAKVDTDGEA
jgi:hypothetical protein